MRADGGFALIAQQFDRLGEAFLFGFATGAAAALPQPGQHRLFGCFAQIVVQALGNTNFWRNDRFIKTSQPASGNKPFGANRKAVAAFLQVATVRRGRYSRSMQQPRFEPSVSIYEN